MTDWQKVPWKQCPWHGSAILWCCIGSRCILCVFISLVFLFNVLSCMFVFVYILSCPSALCMCHSCSRPERQTQCQREWAHVGVAGTLLVLGLLSLVCVASVVLIMVSWLCCSTSSFRFPGPLLIQYPIPVGTLFRAGGLGGQLTHNIIICKMKSDVKTRHSQTALNLYTDSVSVKPVV